MFLQMFIAAGLGAHSLRQCHHQFADVVVCLVRHFLAKAAGVDAVGQVLCRQLSITRGWRREKHKQGLRCQRDIDNAQSVFKCLYKGLIRKMRGNSGRMRRTGTGVKGQAAQMCAHQQISQAAFAQTLNSVVQLIGIRKKSIKPEV